MADNGLDVGFAYDGDTDRCLAVDVGMNIVEKVIKGGRVIE